jgi:hypothetical protein
MVIGDGDGDGDGDSNDDNDSASDDDSDSDDDGDSDGDGATCIRSRLLMDHMLPFCPPVPASSHHFSGVFRLRNNQT